MIEPVETGIKGGWTEPASPSSEQSFRDAMARLGGGVAILSVQDPVGRDCGLTVTAVSSVSLSPPLVLVCVKQDGFIHDALFVADGWSLSFLASDQADAAAYFARSRGPGSRDDFSPWPIRRSATGEAILTEGVAAVECVPHELVDAGDHTVAIGLVVRSWHAPATPSGPVASSGVARGTPLLHVDRAYLQPGEIVE